MLGTIDYVAPEQIEGGEASARGDVYGLACVLFEMLTGAPPFAGHSGGMAKMWAHLNAEPPSVRQQRPDVPRPSTTSSAAGLRSARATVRSAAAFGVDALEAVGERPESP